MLWLSDFRLGRIDIQDSQSLWGLIHEVPQIAEALGIKRYELSEAQWVRIGPLLPGKVSDPGGTASDNRLFVNGVLWASAVRRTLVGPARALRQVQEGPQTLHPPGA